MYKLQNYTGIILKFTFLNVMKSEMPQFCVQRQTVVTVIAIYCKGV